MKFKGTVKKHLGRGTTLGFPTANIDPPDELDDGVYVGTALGKPALIFIGSNPTFNESFRRAEVYIMDYQGDLYDQEIEVETLDRIRDVLKFNSSEDLIEQMKKDEQIGRAYFDSMAGSPLSS